MPYQIPSLKDLLAMLPPRARRLAGYGLAVVLIFAALAWVTIRFGPEILALREEMGEPVVQVTPFEWQQLMEDKKHVGEVCEILEETETVFVCHYNSEKGDDCILSKHRVMGFESRLWKISPEAFKVPDLTLVYGAVSQSGLLGMGKTSEPECDPYTACILPADEHPGASRLISEKPLDDRCWVERYFRFFSGKCTDGCTLSIPYNACADYYVRDKARWVCCYWHEK